MILREFQNYELFLYIYYCHAVQVISQEPYRSMPITFSSAQLFLFCFLSFSQSLIRTSLWKCNSFKESLIKEHVKSCWDIQQELIFTMKTVHFPFTPQSSIALTDSLVSFLLLNCYFWPMSLKFRIYLIRINAPPFSCFNMISPLYIVYFVDLYIFYF